MSHERTFAVKVWTCLTRAGEFPASCKLISSTLPGMRRRAAPTVVMALSLFLLASCGSVDELNTEDAGKPSNNETALAHAAWASLVATVTDTPWTLPPSHGNCLNERETSRTPRDLYDSYEDAIYCSLNRRTMSHLLGRLDHGLGTEVTARQQTCINRKVTRVQVAAVLAAAKTGGDDLAAVGPKLDGQLASVIRQCTRD